MANRLLDQYGRPMPADGQARNGHAPARLHQMMTPAASAIPGRQLQASYDSSQSTPTDRNYWPGEDTLDADRGLDPATRRRTRQRARYEVANDSLAKGMVLTRTNHEVGCGPSLQLLTGSEGFNAMVAARWTEWAAEVQFAQRLWTAVMARIVDGEVFGFKGTNPRLKCAVKLDFKLLECDQVATPFLPWAVPNRIDGIWFDDWSRPTFYDILRWHPGGVFPYWTWLFDTTPAGYVQHMFRPDRPNQHRGVSEIESSLRLFAQRRRFLEAVVKAAETGASITILLKTPGTGEVQDASSIGATEIPQNMVAAIPAGYDASGFHAEQPATTFEMFDRRLVIWCGRPLSMPYAIAACDSSQSNFSSGRLDHQTYFADVKVTQGMRLNPWCDDLFLDWFQEAVRVYGWTVSADTAPPHCWHWVEPDYSDPEAEANSIGTELAIGVTDHAAVLTARGQDVGAVHAKAAAQLGFADVDQYKAWVRDNIRAKFGGQQGAQPQPPTGAESAVDPDRPEIKAMARILQNASPEGRKQIAAWARGAILKGQAA